MKYNKRASDTRLYHANDRFSRQSAVACLGDGRVISDTLLLIEIAHLPTLRLYLAEMMTFTSTPAWFFYQLRFPLVHHRPSAGPSCALEQTTGIAGWNRHPRRDPPGRCGEMM